MKTIGELEEITEVSQGGVFVVNDADDTVTNKITIENLADQINSAAAVDTTPTSGSSNLITSGAVYSYINTMVTQALSAPY